MPSQENSTLVAHLRTLAQLTRTEVQTAETRRTQARTDAVREVLAKNAEHGRNRSAAIEALLRDLGGLPSVVSPLLDRLSGVVNSVIEQGMPLDGALLEDLARQHQLVDRARYLKVLATAAHNTKVQALAERLEIAHQTTVDWLGTLLAEEALGGPTTLRPAPLQAAAGRAGRILTTPAAWSSTQIDRAVDATERTRRWVNRLAGKGAHVAEDVGEALSASRDAGLERAEQVAHRDGAATTERLVHGVRARVNGSPAAEEELPIADYDDLNSADAVAALKSLTESDDLRVIMSHEENTKNRHGVISATETRLAAIAQEVAGIS